MRTFYLDRKVDVSGVSGLGKVAQGVVFNDGTTVLHWISGAIHSTTIYTTKEEMLSIHGHGTSTVLVFIGEDES